MVSDEMVKAAHAAHAQIMWNGGTSDYRMRAALEAVAPAIRAAAMEEAAKIADEREARADEKFDGVVKRARLGERNLELAAATAAGMDHEARAIAAAIRSAKETT